jgi:hypothetical protein
MYGLPEVNLFAADDYQDLGRVYRLRPGFRHGLLRAIAELGLGAQTEENVNVARSWLEEHDKVSTAEIYRDLAEWASPKRLVDKSPIYVYSIESLNRIKRAFPDAYFLHLTRHPCATCESIYKLREVVKEGLDKMRVGNKAKQLVQGRYERLAQIDDPDSLWLKPHLRIVELLDGVADARKMRIKGEDFMADPEKGLRDVAAWLGIDTSAKAVDAMMHPERSPYACYGPSNARFGNDPGYLEKPELREYTPKAMSLDGPIEGNEQAVLSDDAKECAACLGYE